MILNEIHNKLVLNSVENNVVRDIYGFSFTPEGYEKRVVELSKRGFWNLVPFAFSDRYNFAVKMSPGKELADSRVLYFGKHDPISISPNIKSFIPFFNLRFLTDSYFISELKEKWDELETLIKKSTSVFDENALYFLKSIVHDEDLMEKVESEEEEYENLFKLFWNKYDSSPEQSTYNDLLEKLLNLPRYFPETEELELGDWTYRLASLVACKAYGNLSANFEEKQNFYWNFLIQPNGIDCADTLTTIPDLSSDASRELILIAEEFDSNPFLERSISKDIIEHPLYEAIQAIRIKKRTYLGEKHLEAAKVFDVEYNDPVNSWNALVSASYWAGKQQNEAVEVIWEAVIYLSEKSGWNEIHSTLVQQFEFYQKHK